MAADEKEISWGIKFVEELAKLPRQILGELISRQIMVKNPNGEGHILNPKLLEAVAPVIARDLIDEEIVNEFISVIPDQGLRDRFTRWLYSLGKTQRTHLFLQFAQGLVGGETEAQQVISQQRWLVVASDVLSAGDGKATEAEELLAMTRYAAGRKLIKEREEDYIWNQITNWFKDMWAYLVVQAPGLKQGFVMWVVRVDRQMDVKGLAWQQQAQAQNYSRLERLFLRIFK